MQQTRVGRKEPKQPRSRRQFGTDGVVTPFECYEGMLQVGGQGLLERWTSLCE